MLANITELEVHNCAAWSDNDTWRASVSILNYKKWREDEQKKKIREAEREEQFKKRNSKSKKVAEIEDEPKFQNLWFGLLFALPNLRKITLVASILQRRGCGEGVQRVDSFTLVNAGFQREVHGWSKHQRSKGPVGVRAEDAKAFDGV
jgi:hypothetical protein